MPPAPLGLREGSIMRHLLLRQQAVPGDDPSHNLTQTPSIRRRETLPEWRSSRLLSHLGLSRVAGSRRGGSFVGLPILLLLSNCRAHGDNPSTGFTKVIHL